MAPIIFKNVVRTFNFIPELDLFASYLNTQVSYYVSWFPDPNAVANNTFSSSWENKKFYAFPPFSLVEATLAKIEGAIYWDHDCSLVENNMIPVDCSFRIISVKEV